jgi:hypothetical protein
MNPSLPPAIRTVLRLAQLLVPEHQVVDATAGRPWVRIVGCFASPWVRSATLRISEENIG